MNIQNIHVLPIQFIFEQQYEIVIYTKWGFFYKI